MTKGDDGKADGGAVALFVTCLVDFFRPEIAFAAIRLIERTGRRVIVPEAQTCCGQPGYNAGDRPNAIAIAKRTIECLSPYEWVVIPSGSCAGMIKHHYPQLLAGEKDWQARAEALAQRVFELTQFLDMVKGRPIAPASPRPLRLAYHDSCSGLREMKVKEAPRNLLSQRPDVEIRELSEPETCCGFGGTFCLKFGAVSSAMTDRKIADIEKTGADHLAAGDLGCLLAIAGRLQRLGKSIACRHIAEILAGETETPPIGAPEGSS